MAALGRTVAIVVFVGSLLGVFGAIVWVVVSPWIPASGVRRALATGLVAVCTGSFFIVRADEPDFATLAPTPVIVGLLVGVIGALGIAVAMIDAWLRRRLPPAATVSRPVLGAYGLIVTVGIFMTPGLIAAFFGTSSSTFRPPAEVGLALLAVGLATVSWWAARVRDGIGRQSGRLLVAGRGALLIAVLLGGAKLSTEISAILATPGVR